MSAIHIRNSAAFGTIVLALLVLSYGRPETLAAPIPEKEPNTVPEALVRQVQKALSESWTVEAKGKLLTVSRKQSVEVIFYLPNMAPNRGPHREMKTHSFSFTFGPRLDPADYGRKKAEHEKMSREVADMADRLSDITHKFDDFIADPNKPEDVKRVKEYQAAKQRLAELVLPDYFTDANAVWDASRRGFDFEQIPDEKVADECALVRAKVTLLFQPYEMTTDAYRAVKSLNANLETFDLEIRCWPGKGKDSGGPSATLTTRPVAKDRAKDWPVTTLSTAQATALLDGLAREPLFGGLFDKVRDKAEPPDGPCYTLEIKAGNAGPYRLNLGWDATTRKKIAALQRLGATKTQEALTLLEEAARNRWPD